MIEAPAEVRERRRRLLADCRAQKFSDEETGRRLTEAEPEFAAGWLALGTGLLAGGRLDQAEPALWRGLELAPSNPGYYFPLLGLYRERGDRLTADCLTALALWKISFYEEIPAGIVEAMQQYVPSLGASATDPEIYEALALGVEGQIGEQPWPERLLPYRLFNDVQREAETGLDPDLLARIRDNAARCEPVFIAALREAYNTQFSSLSLDAEAMLLALAGELGGIERLDDLLQLPPCPPEILLHAQWGVARLAQRHPDEAFANLRAAAEHASADVRATIAQQLFFLPDRLDRRGAILQMLDGFERLRQDEGAAYLLLTVSTLLAVMSATADSLAVLKRHERQLPPKQVKWLKRELEEETFVPDLIDFSIDELDLEAVCIDRELMPDEDQEEDDDYEEPAPAVKPGRNDPCWCGSGKKYKKCHLQQDEEGERAERQGEDEDDIWRTAWSKLLDFSRVFHRRADMERAIEAFFGEGNRAPDDETVAESGFVVWYVLDYRAAAGARTVLEEYLRRHGERLDERIRSIYESWRDSRFGLFGAERIEAGRGVEVRDVFEDTACFVEDVSSSKSANQWDLMLSRIHRLGDKWLFLGNGLLVPRALLDRIRREVKAGAKQSGMTEGEYFRSRSAEWQRWVLAAHEEQFKGLRLVNFEGDPIEFSTAEYEVGEVEGVAATLRAASELEDTTADDDGGAVTFGWMGEADERGARRSYGHIELGAGKLRLECNSRRRLAAGRELVERLCGGLVRHLGDRFETHQELLAKTRETPKREPSRIDPEIEREIVLKYQAEHYAKWPDERLPALKGKTPREAVMTKAGRAAVEELLRDFENTSERERKAGRPAFDFSTLRATLGL